MSSYFLVRPNIIINIITIALGIAINTAQNTNGTHIISQLTVIAPHNFSTINAKNVKLNIFIVFLSLYLDD